MAYVMTNATALSKGGAQLDMTTLTPPGADKLPWDRSRCTHPDTDRCSGVRGCRVEPEALAEWHRDFAERLSALWSAARGRLARMGHTLPEYVVVLEPQERGAVHVHWATSSHHRAAAAAFASSMSRLGPAYGFGSRVGWDPARGRDSAHQRGVGAYLAKTAAYLAKEAAGESSGLRELLGALPTGRRVCRASTRLTGRTRCTMRNLRLRRWAHVHYAGTAVGEVHDLGSCAEVEKLWQRMRERQEAAQHERAFVVGLELTFQHPPPWWLGQRGQVAEVDYMRRLFR
jgi:hypothetical protein